VFGWNVLFETFNVIIIGCLYKLFPFNDCLWKLK
jgi:hypothetical protein